MYKKYLILSAILFLGATNINCMRQSKSSDETSRRMGVRMMQATMGLTEGVLANIHDKHLVLANGVGLSLLALLHIVMVHLAKNDVEAGKHIQVPTVQPIQQENRVYLEELQKNPVILYGTFSVIGALCTTLIRVGFARLFRTQQDVKQQETPNENFEQDKKIETVQETEIKTPDAPMQPTKSKQTERADVPPYLCFPPYAT